MRTKRRRVAEAGGILLGASLGTFIALYLVYLPLAGGDSLGLVAALGIPVMVLLTVGGWLLTWAWVFWTEPVPPGTHSDS